MEEIIHGVSGAVSGVVAISVWYPLDILRLREQTQILKTKITEEEIETKTNSSSLWSKLKIFLFSNLKSLDLSKNIFLNFNKQNIFLLLNLPQKCDNNILNSKISTNIIY